VDFGLEQVLAGHRPLASCVHSSPFSDAVSVLGSGPALHRRVAGAARAKAASALLAAAKSSFDVVLIDIPGLLQVADATELVGASDAAIIVLGPDEMIRDHVETVDRLKLIGSEVVGYIYDGAPMPTPLARFQRNGSSARPADFDPPAQDFSTVSLGQPRDGANGSSPEAPRG
jgi:Mrp family chromosome partitioning ATPase